jgi:hypothetical protein
MPPSFNIFLNLAAPRLGPTRRLVETPERTARGTKPRAGRLMKKMRQVVETP